jgi:hypothetical protein
MACYVHTKTPLNVSFQKCEIHRVVSGVRWCSLSSIVLNYSFCRVLFGIFVIGILKMNLEPKLFIMWSYWTNAIWKLINIFLYINVFCHWFEHFNCWCLLRIWDNLSLFFSVPLIPSLVSLLCRISDPCQVEASFHPQACHSSCYGRVVLAKLMDVEMQGLQLFMYQQIWTTKTL